MLKSKKTAMLMVSTLIFFILAIGTVSAADTPTANFTSNVTNGTGSLSVQFNDTSTNNPTSWNWDFGDNGTSTQQNPVHNYTKSGNYSVSLSVFNEAGNNSITKTNFISIIPTVTNNLASGTYNTTQTVTLTSDNPEATIYYAIDTTDPRSSATRIQYTTPITINNTTTLRYGAVDLSGNWSPLYLTNYVIGTGGLSDSAWPKFYGNIENTCLSNYTGPQTNTTLWTYKVSGSVSSYVSPVIGADGTIYLGTGSTFYAFNPNGTLKWTFTANGYTPAIGADGTIYLGSSDYNIYALNPDGTLKWKYTTNGIVRGIIISPDGTIYAGSNDVNLYAINPNGTLKWKYTIGGSINYCPAIAADGTIFIGGSDDNFYAINPDGTLKWSYAGCRVGGSASIAADGTIYVGNIINPNLAVFAFNPDGTLKWKSTGVGYGFSSATPAIASDGTIYIGSNDGNIYAYYPTNGTIKWSYYTGNSVQSSPAIGADGTIYFAVYEKMIYAFNPNGTLKWTYSPGTRFYCSPAIAADGTLYVEDRNGNLYAFKDVLPGVSFSANVTSGAGSLTVQFTDNSSYSPIGYAWDFNGDGVIDSTSKTPTWTFTPGVYSVTETVTNAVGNSTLTKTDYIKVGNPDLVTSNLQVPSNPVNGTTYTVNVTVANTGVSDAGSFVVKLYDNNVQVAKTTISGLAAGASTVLNFNWTPTTVGNHVLSVIADVNKQINETNRTNNQITQTVTTIAANLPELILSNLQLPINPVNGTTYTVNVTVANTGTSDAGAFVVKLYDNNVQVGKISLSGLAAGANTILNFNWTPKTVGSHTLSVIADPNNQLNETNRNNNQITQTVNTTPSTLPDLTVSNLELPANPIVGTTYTINVTIANTGASDITNNFAVKLYDNNTQIQKITVTSLAAGANTILTFNWTPTTNGTHNISVIADANKQLTETIENNNQITQAVTAT